MSRGTIIERNRKNFGFQCYLPDENGNKRLRIFNTDVEIPRGKGKRALADAREEARRKGRDLEQKELDRIAKLTNKPVNHREDTIAEYASYYLEDLINSSTEESSEGPKTNYHECVESFLRLQIIPFLGDIKMKDLQVTQVASWLQSLKEECFRRQSAIEAGPTDHPAPRPFFKSIPKILATLSGLLNNALEYEYINRNVATMRKPYRKILQTLPRGEEKLVPSFDEVTEILSVVHRYIHRDDRTENDYGFETVVVLMAYYGLRKEEALGLRWCNISEEHMLIRDTIVKTKGNPALFRENWTKTHNRGTDSSRRDLPLNDFMKDYLRGIRMRQKKDKLNCGDGYKDNGFVCALVDGSNLKPDTVSQKFSRLLKANNLRNFELESLRNALASQLLNETLYSSMVGMWLGHAPKNITEAHYIDPKVNDSLKYIANVIQTFAERRHTLMKT